jgi:mediator of DNA damage checkpoint protein 1
MLQDFANEQKYAVKLSDALCRAKTVGCHLFENHVFYVTPKVPIDVSLLKNVVNAGGGQVSVIQNHVLT